MMRRMSMLAMLTVGLMVCGICSVHAESAEHPRLFVTPQRINEIRKAAMVKGSHHQMALEAMNRRVARKLGAYGEGNWGYQRSYLAREAALLSQISEEKAEKKKYAGIAFDALKAVYDGPNTDRYPDKGYGLSRAMMSMGFGLAYDWCHDTWTAEQRKWVKEIIDRSIGQWPRYDHANFGDVRGSNWVAVCRGGELVLLLCANEDEKHQKRINYLERELEKHIKNGFGDMGVSQEGIGYTEYPGAFLLPAVFAMKQAGDDDLFKLARTRQWWRMAMYTHSFQPFDRKFVMTGVAHSSNFNEGWASLLLGLAPEDDLPYYVYFYDRHMGKQSAGPKAQAFDGQRAGAVWALLLYPESVQPKDPTNIWPVGVADSHGYYFFRNRWQDENDIITAIQADAHHHGHAWDQPEQLALNLMAYNTRFIGGPGKDRSSKLNSALLVDGAYNYKRAANDTGKKIHFEANKQQGYAIVGGGALYEKLGGVDAMRHMLVDFNLPRNQAILSTLDVVKSNKEHTYTWQANLGSESDDDGIKASSGSDAGLPSFVLKGRNGFVKGWVVHPPDATLKASGDPVQIDVKGTNAQIWVVLYVGSGVEPKATVRGKGLDATLSIAGKTVSYDKKADRVVSK